MPPEIVVGIDGAVMEVVGKLSRSPKRKRLFMGALEGAIAAGEPAYIAATMAINAAFPKNAQIPEADAEDWRTSMPGPVNEYLIKTFNDKLPMQPGMGIAFLNHLFKDAKPYLDIIETYRRDVEASQNSIQG